MIASNMDFCHVRGHGAVLHQRADARQELADGLENLGQVLLSSVASMSTVEFVSMSMR